MFNTARMALLAALFAGVAGPVFAADLAEPPVSKKRHRRSPTSSRPISVAGTFAATSTITGRGSAAATMSPTGRRPPQIPGHFDSGKLKGAFSAGAGVGYQVNRYFRTDLTLRLDEQVQFSAVRPAASAPAG